VRIFVKRSLSKFAPHSLGGALMLLRLQMRTVVQPHMRPHVASAGESSRADSAAVRPISGVDESVLL